MISSNKLQSSAGRYYTQINDKSFNFNTNHFIIPKEFMETECMRSIECEVSIYFTNMQGSQVQAIAQSSGKELTLLDGLAQDVYAVASPNVPKYFKYYLVNKVNTTLFVESKKGYFEFYVNIGDASDEELNKVQKYPGKNDSMFQSQGSRYTIYNQLTIPQSNLTDLSCTKCVAYITVIGSKD